MKKLISMVMAAAMVVSLVPATAFADTGSAKAVAKVIDAADIAKGADDDAMKAETTQLQLKVDKDGQYTSGEAKHELTFTLDGAEFVGADNEERTTTIQAMLAETSVAGGATLNFTAGTGNATITDVDKDTFKLTITGVQLLDDDMIILDLGAYDEGTTGIKLKSTSVGKKATISVEGALVTADDLVFAQVKDTGIKATVKKVAEVAVDEATYLERELKIENNVGKFKQHQVFELKLNSGFEFGVIDPNGSTAWELAEWDGSTKEYKQSTDTKLYKGETKAYIWVKAEDLTVESISIAKEALQIVTDDAKAGAEAKLTVKAVKDQAGSFTATADAVVVAKVVDNTVTLSVDEDEDVPVIYSGVKVDNDGITDDSDHVSLEVTIKESAKGALDVKKEIELGLPKGVYVTDVDVTKVDGTATYGTAGGTNATTGDVEGLFEAAYKEGDEEGFKFVKRTFAATDRENNNDKMEMSFKLTLVAEPSFAGDVKLTLNGGGTDKEQEVTIAKFVKPYTVEASQNDLIIDYRNTKVPTNVVVKEAEAGLWKKGLQFVFEVDKMEFEDGTTYTVDDKSGLEVKTIKNTDMGFEVKEESSDEAAAVTISNVSLYMERNIAAGAYNLELITNATEKLLTGEKLFTTSTDGAASDGYYIADVIDAKHSGSSDDVTWNLDSYTEKEGYINVVTAGRDQDDASFTTKVVVPVGESKLYAGETEIALDVPAYISADGYTMLPVRAVATALGINNNNVLWNQATKTVTILYGQRIITMVAGQKVVTVNGNQIPASASVTIVNGRTFLPMRDLATALGVTDITWDAATKTATMNGSQK